MRIGIEVQRLFRSKKHGMDIVALQLIKALQKLDVQNEYFIFVKSGPDSNCIEETRNFKVILVPGITYADWEQIFLPIYTKRYKLDVLHCTSNTAPLFYIGPSIVTLHDVIFLEKNIPSTTFNGYQFLGRIYRKFAVPYSVKKASHIITVSNYEREMIANLLPLNLDKISVIYNAVANHFHLDLPKEKVLQVKQNYNLPSNYIFYIGNTDPKKNIQKTLLAYRQYCIMTSDPKPLLIADISDNFLSSVLEKTNTKSLRSKIQLTGYINNQDLPAIYAGADLFLYPSLRESFGIPMLEAMACGTPVITSNTSALPEVAGNGALLVDPQNHNAIGKAMAEVLESEKLKKSLVENGLQREMEFSWYTSAQKLITIYKNLQNREI